MSKKNKVEYKRVDEEGDDYKRVLATFNPHFRRSPDFEIEFIPVERAFAIGEIFIKEIDSMSIGNLFLWSDRQECLAKGTGRYERGTIPPIIRHMKFFCKGEAEFKRRIISGVKRVFEFIEGEFSEQTAYIYNHFLWSGELGSHPFANEDFNIEKLRVAIEESDYPGFNAEGEVVERSLVDHLFDTHKTEYIQANICRFLEMSRLVTKYAYDKKQLQ